MSNPYRGPFDSNYYKGYSYTNFQKNTDQRSTYWQQQLHQNIEVTKSKINHSKTKNTHKQDIEGIHSELRRRKSREALSKRVTQKRQQAGYEINTSYQYQEKRSAQTPKTPQRTREQTKTQSNYYGHQNPYPQHYIPDNRNFFYYSYQFEPFYQQDRSRDAYYRSRSEHRRRDCRGFDPAGSRPENYYHYQTTWYTEEPNRLSKFAYNNQKSCQKEFKAKKNSSIQSVNNSEKYREKLLHKVPQLKSYLKQQHDLVLEELSNSSRDLTSNKEFDITLSKELFNLKKQKSKAPQEQKKVTSPNSSTDIDSGVRLTTISSSIVDVSQNDKNTRPRNLDLKLKRQSNFNDTLETSIQQITIGEEQEIDTNQECREEYNTSTQEEVLAQITNQPETPKIRFSEVSVPGNSTESLASREETLRNHYLITSQKFASSVAEEDLEQAERYLSEEDKSLSMGKAMRDSLLFKQTEEIESEETPPPRNGLDSNLLDHLNALACKSVSSTTRSSQEHQSRRSEHRRSKKNSPDSSLKSILIHEHKTFDQYNWLKNCPEVSVDSLVAMARIAEKSHRYEDMAAAMKLRLELDTDLNNDERNLFAVAWKRVVDKARDALSNIRSEKKKYMEETRIFLNIYYKNLYKEFVQLCYIVIECTKLDCEFGSSEGKVFFIKMRADFYRYLAEAAPPGNEMKKYQKLALRTYEQAFGIASQELNDAHALRLGCVINFSIFLYDVVQDKQKAFKIAREAFDKAINSEDMKELSKEQFADSTFVMQLLQDNIKLWADQDEKYEDKEHREDENETEKSKRKHKSVGRRPN